MKYSLERINLLGYDSQALYLTLKNSLIDKINKTSDFERIQGCIKNCDSFIELPYDVNFNINEASMSAVYDYLYRLYSKVVPGVAFICKTKQIGYACLELKDDRVVCKGGSEYCVYVDGVYRYSCKSMHSAINALNSYIYCLLNDNRGMPLNEYFFEVISDAVVVYRAYFSIKKVLKTEKELSRARYEGSIIVPLYEMVCITARR